MHNLARPLLALLLLPGLHTLARGDADAVDFKDKTIEFIVPYMPGGGTDAWAKSVLPYFNRYMPGNPQIVIRNVPGGNATKAANIYAEEARLDGLSLLVTAASNQLSYLLGDSRVRYDFSQWRSLLAYRAGVVVYTSDKMGVRNVHEFLRKPDKHLVMACLGPTSDDLFVLLAFHMLNINVSSIFGSPGRGPARKIYLRGEANIDFQTTVSYMTHVKPDEKSGKAVPLFTLGTFDDDMNYVRDPMFPHLPNVAEVYQYVHGVEPSGEAWAAWLSLLRAGHGSLKLLVLPKNTPQAIINTYDVAISKMINDPEFKASVADRLGERAMLSGEGAEKLLRSRTTISDKTRQWITNWIFNRYGVRL